MKPGRKKIDAQAAAVTAKHIQIVRSAKPWLNSMSRASSDAILAVLSKHYARVGVTIVNDLSDLEALVALQPDLIFLGMKFVPVDSSLDRQAPKVWLADYLDEHNIAYTGSSQKAHELELNKQLAKQRVLDAGLSTTPFYVARRNQKLNPEDIRLAFPLFIKPTNRGGGLGIDANSVANNFYDLETKIRSIATNLKSDALIEHYLPGREFSVAILKQEGPEDFAVMPIELIAPPDKQGLRLLSGKVKASNREQAIVVTSGIIKSKITSLAFGVFEALGARDYGRIDIRLDKAGTPHFLEANLLPSLISGYGSFPKACALNIRLGYEQMILSIVRLGLAHQPTPDDDISELLEINVQPSLQTVS
jgi:D-alanine-D-alanine ligase